MSKYRVLIDANDEKGLVHKVSTVFYKHGLNILSNSEFVDKENNKFFMRSVVDGDIDAIKLSKSIKDGLPFMVEDRVASLQKIETDLDEGIITSEKALALTWASYDDTIRITKEIGLFKQKINFKGKVILAKVAKLGSVMMFFSTPNNEVGYVEKEGNSYNYKHITDPKDIKKIVALFDALQKQIKTGYFELPNALVLQGVK